MTAQPVEHDDPLDPVRILADLPANERPFFAAEYRELADAARDPQGWEALNRYLRRMRFHADATKDPEYWRDREAARNGTGHGMPLEEVIREYRRQHAS
jgi:hypothetical protein